MSERKATEVIIKCRINFPALFTPKLAKNSDVPKYGGQLLIEKSDTTTVEAVKKAIIAAKKIGVAEKWGGKVPAGLKIPLRDGDAKPDLDDEDEEKRYPEQKGCFFMNASNTRKPGVVGRDKTTPLTEDEIYSGVWIYASVNFYAFNNVSKGVACSLNNVLKIKDGPRFDGARAAEDDFDDVELEDVDFGDDDIDDLL